MEILPIRIPLSLISSALTRYCFALMLIIARRPGIGSTADTDGISGSIPVVAVQHSGKSHDLGAGCSIFSTGTALAARIIE